MWDHAGDRKSLKTNIDYQNGHKSASLGHCVPERAGLTTQLLSFYSGKGRPCAEKVPPDLRPLPPPPGSFKRVYARCRQYHCVWTKSMSSVQHFAADNSVLLSLKMSCNPTHIDLSMKASQYYFCCS